MTKINIRLANDKDANSIAHTHIASWQKVYRGCIPDCVLDNLSLETRTQQWKELIKNGAKVFVVEHANKIAGFVNFGPTRDDDLDPKVCGEITALYLHPDFWRKGLGKPLCIAALNELNKEGFKEAILWVVEENTGAQQFYKALGFTDTQQKKIVNINQSTMSCDKATENSPAVLHEIRYLKRLS